jgi:hypothetical protein
MLRLAQQKVFPSWGYGVVNGQTTIAECLFMRGLPLLCDADRRVEPARG